MSDLICVIRGKPPFAAISREPFHHSLAFEIEREHRSIFHLGVCGIYDDLIPFVKIGFHAVTFNPDGDKSLRYVAMPIDPVSGNAEFAAVVDFWDCLEA